MANQKTDNGPKVLRIGIVQRGKIIDEREMKKRETVSIGSGAKATFQVSADGMPKVFDLFDYDGKQYWLRYSDSMNGRVQSDAGQVQTFENFKESGQVVERKGSKAVPLPDSSRGKVVIGDVTVLFQFKPKAAAPVKPVLPAELRGSVLQALDMQFAVILLVVFISSIATIAWAKYEARNYVEPMSIEEVDERFQRLIMPKREPQPPREEVAKKSDDEGKKKKEKKKEPEKKAEKKEEPKDPVDAEAAARARKQAVKEKVAGKGLLKVLGAKGEGGSGALADVFSEGGEDGSLADAFSGVQGVDVASEGTSTRGGGSGEQVGIGALGTEGGGNVKTGTKKETAIRGTAQAQAPDVDGDLSAAKINRVMRRQKGAIQACYESALKRNRNLKGKLIIDFEILENGRTDNIDFGGSLRSKDLESCIRRRARSWRFPRPSGGSVFVSFPFVLEPAS
ncbi:MAG: AgmX/PglI C-terminal domain-containing protein [Myxococcota bacterium]